MRGFFSAVTDSTEEVTGSRNELLFEGARRAADVQQIGRGNLEGRLEPMIRLARRR